MGLNMKAVELERGWITANSMVSEGVLYAIQAEVALYGIAWFSTSVEGAGDLETEMMPTGNIRTKEVAAKDL